MLPLLAVVLPVVLSAPLACFAASLDCAKAYPQRAASGSTLVAHAGTRASYLEAFACEHADQKPPAADVGQSSRLADAQHRPAVTAYAFGASMPLAQALRETPSVLPAVLLTADRLRI